MTFPKEVDVLIVGAGPAGLAAAADLSERGYDVHIVDRQSDAGGIPLHCGHSPYGLREFRRLMGGQAYARRLIGRAQENGAKIHTNTMVTALHRRGEVHLSRPDGTHTSCAKAVLLATGARETSRAARFIGGTKPGGVLNTGALQGLVYLARKQPFRRPIVLGTELVSFSALLTCRHAGAKPVAMVEPRPEIVARQLFRGLPLALGIPLHLDTEITEIHGKHKVEAVTLRTDERSRQVECDGVVITGGFRPENALLRASHIQVDPGTKGPVIDQFGRCSDPHYFAAGNILRPVETAPWCWSEGRRVAASIHEALRGDLPDLCTAESITHGAKGIDWHVPQRIVPDTNLPAAIDRLQVEVTRPVRGRVHYDGQSHRLCGRPARRILLPLPAAGGELAIEMRA